MTSTTQAVRYDIRYTYRYDIRYTDRFGSDIQTDMTSDTNTSDRHVYTASNTHICIAVCMKTYTTSHTQK